MCWPLSKGGSPATLRARQAAFAAHIRDPDGTPPPADVEPRRMAVYAELFFNNVEGLLAANFPVLRGLYEARDWRRLARDFYREHRSHTPLFTELAREFIRYLQERGERDAGDPPFLAELAHYEWSELAVGGGEVLMDATDGAAPDGVTAGDELSVALESPWIIPSW